MVAYLLRRVLQAVVSLLAVSVIIFGLTRLSGDPTMKMLDSDSRPEDVALVRKAWGLDRSLPVQYFTYMGNIFRGNFGESLLFPGQDAGALVASRLPATLELALASLSVAALVALPIGVLAAVKRGSIFDKGANLIALLGQSVPTFWFGIVLMWMLSVQFQLLPTSGRGGLDHLILPAVTYGLFPVAALSRLLRSSMLDVLDSEYVKLARIKGIPEWKVIWKHCLRNASLAPLTYFGLIVAGAITGSVVIETVFAWPGVGQLSIQAVTNRDFPLVQTIVLFFATTYIGATLVLDLLYGFLDPRIRLR